MAKTNKTKISYRLEKIRVLQFYINNKVRYNEEKGIVFEVAPGSYIDIKNNELRLLIRSTYYSDENRKEEIGHLEVEFIYKTPKLEKFEREKDSLLIPENFLFTLVNISLGTYRGILFEKTEGSNLEGAYLPIFNVLDFVNNALKKQKEGKFFRLKINQPKEKEESKSKAT